MELAKTVKILKDECDGFYQDLVDEEVEVLEYEPYEDIDDLKGIHGHEYEMFYIIATNRLSRDPYMEGKPAEMVWAGDVEVITTIKV